MPLPAGFTTWNRALQGAFRKGVAAQLAGEPIGACPYEDKRKWCGRLTWSRAFQAAWADGWKYAEQDRADALITLTYTKCGK